jgi:hypothetical protein
MVISYHPGDEKTKEMFRRDLRFKGRNRNGFVSMWRAEVE